MWLIGLVELLTYLGRTTMVLHTHLSVHLPIHFQWCCGISIGLPNVFLLSIHASPMILLTQSLHVNYVPPCNYRRYSRVRKWTLGLSGGGDQIAVIRASGSISRVRSPLSVSGSGIIGEQFIEKIRTVRGRLIILSSPYNQYRRNSLLSYELLACQLYWTPH